MLRNEMTLFLWLMLFLLIYDMRMNHFYKRNTLFLTIRVSMESSHPAALQFSCLWTGKLQILIRSSSRRQFRVASLDGDCRVINPREVQIQTVGLWLGFSS